ncbi:MAG: ATP-dependent RecD-like DNA helicase [Erysipelotrichaceae bacterium]|nr:ATP-dependent RecD-like DNA helicase [Erysipelotrichaceae bacterium]
METIEITGRLIKTIFHSESNLFTVGVFKLYELNEKDVTVTGYFPKFNKDLLIALSGYYTEHPRYGMQFQVSHYRRILPTDRDSIINYLKSPIFKGIGKGFAEKLVDTFGEDVLNQLKDDITIIRSIKGWTKVKEEALYEGLILAGQSEEAMKFFTTHGLGIRNIMRLDRIYGTRVLEIVKENPYRLVEEVDGIGFITADKLAMSMGFEADDPRRLRAALIMMIMNECMRTGDSYVEFEALENLFSKEFSDHQHNFDSILDDCVRQKKIIRQDQRYFHPSQYYNEKFIASYFETYPNEPLDPVEMDDLDKALLDREKRLSIHYDLLQNTAIHTFFSEPITILTGGPGTGKTTVVGAMIDLYKTLYATSSVICCAPTGRAAKRLNELTGTDSTTIHALLKWDLEANTFGKNEADLLALDCLIIDEFSMVDTWLFGNLLKAAKNVKKILIVGDVDQLPSVSPGSVLRDLIDSNRFNTIALQTIYRQKEGSDVIELAHQIRENKVNLEGLTKDIRWIDCSAIEVKQLILDIIDQGLQKGYSVSDIQVLAPMYNRQAGIDALNHAVQKMVNPPNPDKNELQISYVTFREGDKILQLKNQPPDDVYNGDIGILLEVIHAKNDENKQNRLVVDFDGRIVEYTSESFINITLAYCISIHKSQGSEYPIVILPVLNEQKIMLQRRLLYTAITRASKSLILIGEKSAFLYGLSRKDENPRKTCLLEYLSE